MSLFTLLSNDAVLRVGPFAEITALAGAQRKTGRQVRVRRATADEQASRGWAVRLFAAGTSDLLRCLDEDDATTTLAQVQAAGLRAEVIHI